jgi:hypothetical protein
MLWLFWQSSWRSHERAFNRDISRMTSDSLPQPTRDEAIALLRKGLDKALQTAAAQYVMPICWIAAEKGKPLILGNGSAFMLDAGAGPFLVTANHVYAEFRAARVARPDAEGGYSTLAQMNTVELCLPVIGLLLGPVLIYMDFPSTLS